MSYRLTDKIFLPLVLAVVLSASASAQFHQTSESTDEDTRIWLEEVEGERALSAVKEWNTRSLDRLENDDRYANFFEDALKIVNATDKIIAPIHRNGYIYNFWRDENNVRGLLRRTPLDSYLSSEQPEWETLLDVDAFALKEGENWVYGGTNCLPPEYDQCLMALSEGGKDAREYREWNYNLKSFVKDGFYIPEAKSDITWLSEDRLLIATDWGEGSLTQSGYSFEVKILNRGDELNEAKTVFRGERTDMSAGSFTIEHDSGELIPIIVQNLTFFDAKYFWLKDLEEPIRMPLPTSASISTYFKGQLIVSLKDDWTPSSGSTEFAKGSLISFDLDKWLKDQQAPEFTLIYEPNARSAVRRVDRTKSKVLITIMENVVSRVYQYEFEDEKWTSSLIELEGSGPAGIMSASNQTDLVFLSQAGFITPRTYYMSSDIKKQDSFTKIKSAPERFNADDLVVEQFEVASSDGEMIPYFVVRKKDIQYDGSNPTIVNAYGGFQVSMTPSYAGVRGKLWLERGGVYVTANIRGGGEFGPSWHQAGLKTKRQLIYDDFIAVAEDLIDRGITSPRRMGAIGGSNGGLLMGVMYVQRPDLWNGLVSQVPLLDMLRYHKLLAGASWVGEYGDPEVEEERDFLSQISPYHNVNTEDDAPELFLITSTKDDRVHPGHARKMAKLLEEIGRDFVYYENIDGGHSAAANLRESAHRTALEYIFFNQKLVD